MIEEELKLFRTNDSTDSEDELVSKKYTFAKTCLQQNFFSCILEQLRDLTRNAGRTRIKPIDEDGANSSDDDITILVPIFDQIAQEEEKDKKEKEESKIKKKPKPGGGIGYTTQNGKGWDVNAYLKNKEAKNQQMIKLLEVLQMLADACSEIVSPLENLEGRRRLLSEDDEQLVKSLFLESALLPILEAALRSGSILEMAKEFDLYEVLLKLVETFAQKQALIGLLFDIGPDYEPRQKDSLFALLKKARQMSQVFMDCLALQPEDQDDKNEGDTQDQPKLLSERILDVYDGVSMTMMRQNSVEESKSLQQILSLPPAKAYFELCQSFRLTKASFRPANNPSGQYEHHYATSEKQTQLPSSRKLIRLAQEIADLTNSLPCELTNSVYSVVDKQRVDFMKCIIMGSASTPYAHGAFVYDIYFDDNYPDGPPKINLSTTGGGAIRFNPNLYNSGKVCLSLLGTWRGTATENWNPKLSTLLQVILSIQAIIMSNEVYFNEPGYEHLMGTPQGEKLNTGYANVVRYGTLKYAIIEQLKNPTPGFEDVIRRNFFLKKDMILEEVDGWLEREKTEEANYTDGLTSSHNPTITSQFAESSDAYRKAMIELRKELYAEFAKLDSPYSDGAINNSFEKQKSNLPAKKEEKKKEPIVAKPEENKINNAMEETQAKLDQIDVSYAAVAEESKEFKTINVDDEGVKDRWSRYIGAMGIEAVAKQAEAVVYIDQLGGLGIEIAKNIVLAGCKELILGPTAAPTFNDLTSQFFIEEKDVRASTQQSRVSLCKQKLQELNPYVKVTSIEDTLTTNQTCLLERHTRIAVFTDPLKAQIKNEELAIWNELLRSQGIQMIVADQNGVFSRILTDFGESHTVVDKDGEEIQEVMIQQMSPKVAEDPAQGTLVELLTGATHNFEEGTNVEFKEIIGMNKPDESSINSMIFKIKEIANRNSFVIECDSSQFSPYERNGMARQVKPKVQVGFTSLREVLQTQDATYFDENLQILDFAKMENFRMASTLYKVMGEEGKANFKALVVEEAKKIEDYEEKERFQRLATAFEHGFECSIGPLAAFVGGLVAQEIVKAITGKFMPIKQEMYLDVMELFNRDANDVQDQQAESAQETRYSSLQTCFGSEFVEQIRNAKVFMIGAGAIGCELLKNFAMVGLGSGPKGQITLTDPDIIELSNLNRQFLFREKHLRKPKSMTAAAAAAYMNPDLKGHISARLDKLHKDTDHIYTEEFFKQQTVVANALDNVQARLFIDQKCVNARVPLLDSGTLGAKGHVQVVIPHKTESYGEQKDPEENNEIPHCTLKMFPEETLHCVEWAKDMLGSFFGVNPQNFNKLKSAHLDEIGFSNFEEVKNINKAIKMAKKRPKDFSDCVEIAVNKFYKLFRDNILQLILVYPLDKMNPDGRPFWSLPKREPSPQDFNAEDSLHRCFIAAYSCLLANMYGVEIPYDQPRSEDAKQRIAEIARLVEPPIFVPNAEKARAIQSQVDKEQGKEGESENTKAPEEKAPEESKAAPTMIDTTITKSAQPLSGDDLKEDFCLTVLSEAIAHLKVEEFEKDDDQNFHVDFIHACANVRAMNYSLPPMDWLTVKLKAGKIVPALATTTAAVAGLQTIELLKLLKHKQLDLDNFKNTFLNLAIPVMYMSEPGPPISHEIKPGLKIDTWQRWDIEVTAKTKLGQIVRKLEQQFGLEARDVIYQATHLFFYALRQQDLPLKHQAPMMQTVGALLRENVGRDVLQEEGHADLTITFIDPDAVAGGSQSAQGDSAQQQQPPDEPATEKILEHVPTVRIILQGGSTKASATENASESI